MHYSNRRSQGFTLIELLVVIAIIAILAAILFPVFSTVRARARQISGASNTKQMALGIALYSNDFDSDFPLSGWSDGDRGDGTHNQGGVASDGIGRVGTLQWSNVVGPYVKSGDLVTDSSDSSSLSGGWLSNPVNGEHSLLINDLLSHNPLPSGDAFGDNEWNGGGKAPENIQVGKSENTVNAPSDCVLLMEGHCAWGGDSGAKSYDGFQAPTGKINKFLGENNISQYATINVTGTNYSGWHVWDGLPIHNQRSGTNAAFVDGHVKFFKVTDGNGNNTIADTLPFRKNIDPTQAGMDKGDWQHRGLGKDGPTDNWE